MSKITKLLSALNFFPKQDLYYATNVTIVVQLHINFFFNVGAQ